MPVTDMSSTDDINDLQAINGNSEFSGGFQPSVNVVDSANNKNTLFVGDLATYCTEANLEELFSRFGTVTEVKIMKSEETNRNLSYGFVKFAAMAAAQEALSLEGEMLLGRKLRVNWAAFRNRQVPRETRQNDAPQSSPVHVSFISAQINHLVTEASLRELFAQYGEVIDVSIKKSVIDKIAARQSGYGFVHFHPNDSGIRSAQRAAEFLADRTINEVNYKSSLSHSLIKLLNNDSPPQHHNMAHSGNYNAHQMHGHGYANSTFRDREGNANGFHNASDFNPANNGMYAAHQLNLPQSQQHNKNMLPNGMYNANAAPPNPNNIRHMYINTPMMAPPNLSPHFMQLQDGMHPFMSPTQSSAMLVNPQFAVHPSAQNNPAQPLMLQSVNHNGLAINHGPLQMNGFMAPMSPNLQMRVMAPPATGWMPSPAGMSPNVATMSSDSMIREDHFLSVNKLLQSPGPGLVSSPMLAYQGMMYPMDPMADNRMISPQQQMSQYPQLAGMRSGFSPSSTMDNMDRSGHSPSSMNGGNPTKSFNSDVVMSSAAAKNSHLASKGSSARMLSNRVRGRLPVEQRRSDNFDEQLGSEMDSR